MEFLSIAALRGLVLCAMLCCHLLFVFNTDCVMGYSLSVLQSSRLVKLLLYFPHKIYVVSTQHAI